MTSAIETTKRRFLLAVLASAALMGAFLLVPASGQAHKGGPPEDDCAAEYLINVEGWGDSCFESYGDEIWVRDQTPNQWSVRVQVQTNYGETRWCANTHGADSWHQCDFDFRELGDRIGPDPDHPGMDIYESACVRRRMFEQRESAPQVGFTRKWTRWSDWWDTSIAENDCTGP